ncbi:MAG: PIN domain-containing protein [Spirochaetes bacterium]|nr:PIN domain-containing protein [Spirochaetota bacterium]
MKKLKIYLDTSVIGGSFDDEFSEYSINLIENIKKDMIFGVISEITIRELENAPDFAKNDFKKYINKLEIVDVTDEIKELAENYIKDKVISRNYYEDALHIACATIYQVDVLVS